MIRRNSALRGALAATLLAAAGTAHAADDVLEDLNLPIACNEALLAGVYGFNTNGLVVETSGGRMQVLEGARQAGTGTVEFRADGTATFRLERFFSGVPELEGAGPFFDEFEATWQVRPDCTGTADLAEFGLDVDWVFIAVENASELHFVSGAGTLAQVDAIQLFRR